MACLFKAMGRSVDMASRLLKLLDEEIPNPTVALRSTTPLQLLVATILSAQCTDERVNQVTKRLFARYRTAQDYAHADVSVLEKEIRSTGFYKAKTRSLIRCGQALVDRFDGQVPRTMDDLITLPGVGRKTANVILGTAFDTPGIAVDTHCGRIARRLGFTKNTDPVKVERDLMKIWEREDWSLYSHLLVFHGRAYCTARAPRCSECPVHALCPFPDTREGKKIAK